MSFFVKVKQGASEAARKAQQTVEISKLKAQISGKEKEMDKLFRHIGELVYKASYTDTEQEVDSCCEQLESLDAEIQLLEERIKHVRFEKSCTCGKVVSMDARFCPDCGAQMEDETKPGTTLGEIRVICSHCLTENELGAKYCSTCGNTLSSGDMETSGPNASDNDFR